MRDDVTGVCSECASPPEAYHARSCSLFKGYHCHRRWVSGWSVVEPKPAGEPRPGCVRCGGPGHVGDVCGRNQK